jgi:hypothetical protein
MAEWGAGLIGWKDILAERFERLLDGFATLV